MEHPTESQLEDMIIDLKEQLKNCNDDTISDELIREIKYRKNQLKKNRVKKFDVNPVEWFRYYFTTFKAPKTL